MKGYIQVYTGDGKGKTTAALGLALRAAGAGLKIFIAQFVKDGHYSEIQALERFSDAITVKQFGRGRFVDGRASEADIQAAQAGIKAVILALKSQQYNVVIMDEANVALKKAVLNESDILNAIAAKPEPVELIITGRYASPRIIEEADLVTDMTSVKHYFDIGVKARTGIEK